MSNINKELLFEYKKYDFLNFDDHPFIKILVSYIKPSFLFKTSILTPIHLGRAIEKERSKDGIQTESELEWLHSNCIGDDDFPNNISEYNRRIGFYTGTFWALHNYSKLGNPEYFGSFGYRRLFNPCFLNDIQDYDAIIPEPVIFQHNITIREQFIAIHSEYLYNIMIKIFNKVYSEESESFHKYINGNLGFFYEIYVFKKEIFFSFCAWIEPIIRLLIKTTPCKSDNDFRDIAFIIERITGYYCNKLLMNKDIKTKKCEVITTEKKKADREGFKKMISILRRRTYEQLHK